ncbi:hypothetical protein GCM10027610_111020 [Dactylosporangium cerinum]
MALGRSDGSGPPGLPRVTAVRPAVNGAQTGPAGATALSRRDVAARLRWVGAEPDAWSRADR